MDDDSVSDAIWQLQPSTHWLRVTAINVPTRGEPRRMITGGPPPIPGRTVLEERGSFRNYDHIFTDLSWEPRGHADMYGAVVTASFDADLDIFFLHNEGYSTMRGHAIIVLTKLATGARPVRNDSHRPRLTINVAAGNIHAQAVVERGTNNTPPYGESLHSSVSAVWKWTCPVSAGCISTWLTVDAGSSMPLW